MRGMTQSTQIMVLESLPNIEVLLLIADWQDDLRMKNCARRDDLSIARLRI